MKLIRNGFIFENDKSFIRKDILINNRKITKIDTKINDEIDENFLEVLDAEGCLVVPGFIDIHTHGANGFDIMKSDYEALDCLSCFFASKGVTTFLPTTMTDSIDNTDRALRSIRNAIEKGTTGARIIGINMEGPFISPEYKGAHPKEYIIEPDPQIIKKFIHESGNNVRIMTLAPELKGIKEIVNKFSGEGIVFAVGHSGIDFISVKGTFDNGFRHVTHLFNAMTGLHHRAPGLVGAALDSDNVTVEIIPDCIHVDPAVIRATIKCKTPERVVVITDSILAAGINEGRLPFGGQQIIVKDGAATLENGILAGSTLTMIDAVRNMVLKVGVSLEDIIKMVSSNPAKVINIYDRKGSISEGKDADLVILDEGLNIRATIVEGAIVYQI